jgi:lactoylglutathione lyase
MMRVEHVGVWAADLERLREFYATYLGATAGAKYANPTKGFESYFLTLPGGGARLELMRVPGLAGARRRPPGRAGPRRHRPGVGGGGGRPHRPAAGGRV